MSRSKTLIVALLVGASLSSIAEAQSPPGGFVAATVPGGTKGAAGQANIAQAIRGGNVVLPRAVFDVDAGPLSTGSISRPTGGFVSRYRSDIR